MIIRILFCSEDTSLLMEDRQSPRFLDENDIGGHYDDDVCPGPRIFDVELLTFLRLPINFGQSNP